MAARRIDEAEANRILSTPNASEHVVAAIQILDPGMDTRMARKNPQSVVVIDNLRLHLSEVPDLQSLRLLDAFLQTQQGVMLFYGLYAI